MFNHQAGRKFSRRTKGIAATAGASAALIAAGVGLLPAAASADTTAPATPSRPAAVSPTLAEPGLGTGNLIQSEDFFQTGLGPWKATIDVNGNQALSACSGEENMIGLTKAKADTYADATWKFDTQGSLLTEAVAETSTTTSAVSYEKKLNTLVQSCQNEPAGHWHYGKSHSISVTGGEGKWYAAYNGDVAVSGGVAVIRSGHRFGIVELTGQPSDDAGYMKGIAAISINKLAG